MDDKTLRQDIIDELDFEPSIDAAKIGVAVQNGIVTLTGHVPTYAQKSLAETAAKRIRGVRGIAEELKVEVSHADPYRDDDIIKRALAVIDMNVLIPPGRIQVKAERGWLTLSGEVEWDYQRAAVVDDLRKLRGVLGISNNMTIKPRITALDVERRIQDALKRSAEVEAKSIHVSVHNGTVRLEGKVHSLADRLTLARAAWSTPGVHTVEDHVLVA